MRRDERLLPHVERLGRTSHPMIVRPVPAQRSHRIRVGHRERR
ncbi:hypothetical protein ACFPM0_07165 [Pseudonocardia sulfidoxydans]